MVYETEDKYIQRSEKAPLFSGNPTFAREIHTPIEIVDSENMKSDAYKYKARGESYIPVPDEKKYFDIDEDCTRELKSEMIIDPYRELVPILRDLTQYPFLLVDSVSNIEFQVYSKSEDTVQDDNEINRLINSDPEEIISFNELSDKYPDIKNEVSKEIDFRYGIITLSEINKRYIKDSIYPLIAGFECEVSNIIEEEYPNSEELFDVVGTAAEKTWQESKGTDAEVHISEFINLKDMETLVSDSKILAEKCGFNINESPDFEGPITSLGQLRKYDPEKVFNEVRELRNKIMHANRALVHDEEDIQNVVFQIHIVMSFIEEISSEFEIINEKGSD